MCENCGTRVEGNGYTNHCFHCLWSKHVDVNPGDRGAACGGLMKPVFLESRSGEHTLTHRCAQCGKTIRNKTSPADNVDAILTN